MLEHDQERESSPDEPIHGAPVQPANRVTAPQQVVPAVIADEPEPEAEAPEAEAAEPDPASPGPAEPSIDVEQLEAEARRQLEILREHARDPSPPPRSGERVDEFVWGLAQPLLGVRVLLRHGDLFVRGLVPAAAFVLVLALVVDGSDAETVWGRIAAFYGALVGAAAISPVVFCRNYARLAAEARRHLDVPYHEPYLRSFKQAIAEAIVQAIVLGIGVAPFAALISSLPVFGGMWAAVLGWLWVLHWIVVEALDAARTLPPEHTPESLELRHAKLDPPWYSAAALGKLRFPLGTILLPVRLWGIVMARLGRRWRGEVAVIELRPWLAVGFGLGASLLLLLPIVNLVFRPAIVVAASHVLGRLEPEVDALFEDEEDEEAAEPEMSAQLALQSAEIAEDT